MDVQYTLTPWESSGEVDYQKVIREFGVELIDDELIDFFQSTFGEIHPFLKRKIFFSHRDLKWLFSEYKNGNPFYLYTGRGPSGKVHLGHLLPWVFTKWLQDKFDVELYFQLTDDEKFYFRDQTIKEIQTYTIENVLDIIALGFNPKKTFIFTDFGLSNSLYRISAMIAKKITFSTLKSSFGLSDSANLGQIFFTSIQAAPAILKSVINSKNIPCLIPCAIDQDPHFRLARDVFPKIGFLKPACIHSLFLPALQKDGKMSTSKEEFAIFTTDSPDIVKKKVANAFTGGQGNKREQMEKGGNPDICIIFKYFYMFFMLNDEELNNTRISCKSGTILCGECKQILMIKINNFLGNHQKKRSLAKNHIEEFLISEKIDLEEIFLKK